MTHRDCLALTCRPGLPRPLRLGFFPMRPALSWGLRQLSDLDRLLAGAAGWLLQPKLNGDRVALTQWRGKLYAYSRHGAPYRQAIRNLDKYRALPEPAVLDGEVYRGRFIPFEALALGRDLLWRACVSERAAAAKAVAEKLDPGAWCFDPPTLAWLRQQFATQPPAGLKCQWEGVVRKKLGCPYLPAASASQRELPAWAWYKHKWVDARPLGLDAAPAAAAAR